MFIFLFIAIEGLLVRMMPFHKLPLNLNQYNLIQSHSHTAFLGWTMTALLIFILYTFRIDLTSNRKTTDLLFWILYILIIVSGFSFLISGYSIISIILLVLFLIISYFVLILLFRKMKSIENTLSANLIKTGIVFYFISSFATWTLPIIIINGMKNESLYYYDIFFYLHFLYNGFIAFVILALIIHTYKRNIYNNSQNTKLITILSIGTVMTYTGSIIWSDVNIIFNYINFTGSILILYAFYKLIKPVLNNLQSLFWSEKVLLYTSLLSFLLKILMQIGESEPGIASMVYPMKRYLIIGYMHLITLGLISTFILSYAIRLKFIYSNKNTSIVSVLFISAIVLSEALLFTNGILMMIGSNDLGMITDYFLMILTILLTITIGILTVKINISMLR